MDVEGTTKSFPGIITKLFTFYLGHTFRQYKKLQPKRDDFFELFLFFWTEVGTKLSSFFFFFAHF